MKTNRAFAISALAAVLATAGPAAAVVRKVPSVYPTINSAITAANPGDTILIAPGDYRENVIVDKSDLKITTNVDPKICKNTSVTIDGSPGGSMGDGFDVTAENTTIQCLTIRHADYGIECDSDGLTVDRVRILRPYSYGIYVYADNFKLLKNTIIAGYDEGIDADGDDGVIQDNSIYNTDSTCLYLYGDNMKVTGNLLELCYSEGIYLSSGDDVVIQNNIINTTYDTGIETYGDRTMIKGNTLTNAYEGIYADGDALTVQNNTVKYPQDYTGVYVDGDSSVVIGNTVLGAECDYCMELYGDGLAVSNNTLSFCYYAGMYLSGDNPVITNNTVTQVGDDSGFDISCSTCDAGRIEGNKSSWIASGYYGFDISGDNWLKIANNTATNSSSYGFYLSVSDTTFTGNKANWNGYYSEPGFYISGDSNLFSGNTATNNGDAGFEVSGTGNTFDSNTSNSNYDDGFEIYGDANTFNLNTAKMNVGEGFENRGTNTVFTNNITATDRKGGHCVNDVVGSGASIATNTGNTCPDGSNFAVESEID